MKIHDLRKQTPKRSTTRPISAITKIVRHHSATTGGDFWAFWNGRWKGSGWKTGGYHEIILRDGSVQLCYDPTMATNGVLDHNSYTYHICVVGNGQFTEAQEKTFDVRAKLAMERFGLKAGDVVGHREIPGAATECPGINMNTVRARLVGAKVETPKTEIKNETVKTSKPKSSTSPYDLIRRYFPNVSVLQRQLIAVGENLSRFRDDGVPGDETLNAIKSFQRKERLTVDGIPGPKTQARLRSKIRYVRLLRLMNPRLRGNDVRLIQRVLGVTADGIFGPITQSAVREYQRKHRLKVDGIVGPQTWSHLFG
ncbi:amidase [Bacillus phage Mgbh1]|uniref:N-acetylmuramoyl-L-alanine amidase n=1 Tax=Bacillus phage Mgbh1 TaxID=1796993 RepID=A0A142F1N7_9CAUD|nr:amidase [Bacillus phage Mgbh1]AMQ66694.1 N-acetylmuramoyl-L-alanine amidase [Bacillus phage Mgbh1]